MEISLDDVDTIMSGTKVICVVNEGGAERRYFVEESVLALTEAYPDATIHIYDILVSTDNTLMSLINAKTGLHINYKRVAGTWYIDHAHRASDLN